MPEPKYIYDNRIYYYKRAIKDRNKQATKRGQVNKVSPQWWLNYYLWLEKFYRK